MCVACEKEFWFYLGGRRYHTLAKSINVPSLLNKFYEKFLRKHTKMAKVY